MAHFIVESATDADIQRLFAEKERLKAEIRHKIEEIRFIYQELDDMVSRLYES